MPLEQTNPITGHEVTLLMPTPKSPELFGWIRLRNGAADAGYVYLTATAETPHLGGTRPYIVTTIAPERVELLLGMLRSTMPLQIRFFDPQAAGIEPSVFIEPRGPAAMLDREFLPVGQADRIPHPATGDE